MCGIWVSIGGEFGPDVLRPVRTRGPDGEGWIVFETPAGTLRFGHTRLSIYDPGPGSAQPMQRGDQFAVVFNGSIYNYRTLRRELETKGFVFSTAGDVEVLIAAYEAWGEDALRRLEGMFAVALFDRRRNRLLLARDRFGEKPLLIATRFANRAVFAAASDIHQLREAGAEPWSLEPQVAADFLNLGRVDTDGRTFVQAVSKAPAGASLLLDLSSSAALARSIAEREWKGFASLPAPDARLRDRESAVRQLREALEDSLALRLEADVEVGSCLSGGLDSSAIVALTRPLLRDRQIHCFAAVFDGAAPDGSSYSERPFVEAAAAAFPHAKVHYVTPTGADCAAQIDAIVTAQGEPFAHTSICAQWFVMKAARDRGVKVLLDGQGADELLGGYDGMVGRHLADLLAQPRAGAYDRAVMEFSAYSGRPPGYWRQLARTALIAENVRRRVAALRRRWPPASFPAPAFSPAVEPSRLGLSRFDGNVRALLSSLSLPSLLRYEDRNAMWHGVETRLPFLSEAVANLALRMPAGLKLHGGRTKDVLRRAVADVVPQAITDRRRKLGFASPHDEWVSGSLKSWTQQRVDQVAGAWTGLVDATRARNAASAIGPAAAEDNGVAFRIAVFGAWADTMGVAS